MPVIKKIFTDLVELTSFPADGDQLAIVDISEALDINKTKRISALTLFSNLVASIASTLAVANTKVTKPGNPSNTSILQQSTAGVTSVRNIKQVVQIQLVSDGLDVLTSDVAYFFVPSTLDGMNLVRAAGFVLTAGSTNPTTIQIRNLTKYPSNDSLSTAISIASGGTIGTVGVINTSYDDISTNDKIKISIPSVSSTKPKGLIVVLEYQLP